MPKALRLVSLTGSGSFVGSGEGEELRLGVEFAVCGSSCPGIASGFPMSDKPSGRVEVG